MNQWRRWFGLGLLLVHVFVLGVRSEPVIAAGGSKSIGIGSAFYSGDEAENILPGYAFDFSFSANSNLSAIFVLVNRFTIETGIAGAEFIGSLGSYFSILGAYNFLFRTNIGKEGVIPFFEVGPMLGMYVIRLSAKPSASSQNQTAFKYGYTIGLGFDWTKGKGGMGGGWGVGVNYFSFFPSPALFEFPAGTLSANGIKVELKWIFGAAARN